MACVALVLPALPRSADYKAFQGEFEVGPANKDSAAEAERWNPAEPDIIPSFPFALTEENGDNRHIHYGRRVAADKIHLGAAEFLNI